MLKQAFLRSIASHQSEILVMITGGGVSWITSYFLPIVGAVTATVTLATVLIGFLRELRKYKKE